MDFELTDKQRKLVQAFRAFGEETFTPEHVHQWRRDQGLPDEVAKGFVDLYFGLEELEDGDGTFSLCSQALIIEELSRCAGATLPFQNDLFNLSIVRQFADEGEFADVLKDYRETGRLLFALAISEPEAGSDAMNMQTYTRTVDEHLILNGRKTYVNNGEYAPYIMVAAIDRDCEAPGKYPPMTFWLLPRHLKGVSAYPINKIGQSMLPFATLVFDNVELSPAYRLNGRQEGFRQLFRLLEFGRVFTCASSLGMARAAMEDAVAHARSRKAFGVQIGRFQQIEQMLTDMEVSIYNMNSMLYRAASVGGAHEALRARRRHRGGIERHADTRRHGIHGGRAGEPAVAGLPRQPDRGRHRPDHGVHRLAAHHGEVLTPPRRTRKRGLQGCLPHTSAGSLFFRGLGDRPAR